jgi:hypothetical protein
VLSYAPPGSGPARLCRGISFRDTFGIPLLPGATLQVDCGYQQLDLYSKAGPFELPEHAALELHECYVNNYENNAAAAQTPVNPIAAQVFGGAGPDGGIIRLFNSTARWFDQVCLARARARAVPLHIGVQCVRSPPACLTPRCVFDSAALRRTTARTGASDARAAADAHARLQFGRIAYGLVKTGTVRSIFENIPTNPRFVAGRFVGSQDSAWALTLVTSNWNTSVTAGDGPQYIMDNATMWAAPSLAAARPLIAKAYSSTDPPAWCFDQAAGSAHCMDATVAARYREDRGSTEVFGSQFSPGAGNTQSNSAGLAPPRQGSGSGGGTNAAVWAAPLGVTLAVLALLGAYARPCSAQEI